MHSFKYLLLGYYLFIYYGRNEDLVEGETKTALKQGL